MDRHLGEWRFVLDRLSQDAAPDWDEVVRVVAAIATTAGATELRQAASQAQPTCAMRLPVHPTTSRSWWRGGALPSSVTSCMR